MPSRHISSTTPTPSLGEMTRLTASSRSRACASARLTAHAPLASRGLTSATRRPSPRSRSTMREAGLLGFSTSPTTAQDRWRSTALPAPSVARSSSRRLASSRALNPITLSTPPSTRSRWGAAAGCSTISAPAQCITSSSSASASMVAGVIGEKWISALSTPSTRRPVARSCRHTAPTVAHGATPYDSMKARASPRDAGFSRITPSYVTT
mmetsp:Transcript_13685/g.31461  ORF Transcript_13685/g.31461 Transcript_13685/m.31461 type:complete len:210 (-) Transcript_13685:343-972(-)